MKRLIKYWSLRTLQNISPVSSVAGICMAWRVNPKGYLRWRGRKPGGTWEASGLTPAPSLEDECNPGGRLLRYVGGGTRVHTQKHSVQTVQTETSKKSKGASNLCHHKHPATKSLSLLCFCRKRQCSQCCWTQVLCLVFSFSWFSWLTKSGGVFSASFSRWGIAPRDC